MLHFYLQYELNGFMLQSTLQRDGCFLFYCIIIIIIKYT